MYSIHYYDRKIRKDEEEVFTDYVKARTRFNLLQSIQQNVEAEIIHLEFRGERPWETM